MEFENIKVGDWIISGRAEENSDVVRNNVDYKVVAIKNGELLIALDNSPYHNYHIGKFLWKLYDFKLSTKSLPINNQSKNTWDYVVEPSENIENNPHAEPYQPFGKEQYASMFDAYLVVGDLETCKELHKLTYGEEVAK